MKYEILGEPLPVVVCYPEQNETLITERGSMCWMSPNMKMETTSGGLGKAFGRMFSGESMFVNRYTATGGGGMIAFASSFPGSIMKFDVTPGNDIIAQKSAFLASESGVEFTVHFQRRFGAGFFGGEGFIMQRFSGHGMVFIEVDGFCKRYDLNPGQRIIVDTGYLAAMTASVSMDIESVPGLKNKFLGGEGFFNTVLTGPGTVWLQSMPISAVAGAIRPFIPTGNN
ncbi:MAG: TIGR00266 family protein [Lachnospiraceae bacterium]|nr:TIGR00266 family protein [Lachnospiraceae bacterium]